MKIIHYSEFATMPKDFKKYLDFPETSWKKKSTRLNLLIHLRNFINLIDFVLRNLISNFWFKVASRRRIMANLLDNAFPNDNWTRVEIFLRAYGRLPDQVGDAITQETLDKFCSNWEKGELETVTVDLESVYRAIKEDRVKLSNGKRQ